jgi:hypothetical protein
VPGTEWEYKETDRETQRQVRKVFEVPLYLNPNEQSDWNDRQNGRIIVTNRFDSAYPRDIVFVGQPTPDMEPLDEEAQKITDGYVKSGAWKHPIETLDMNYSQSVLSDFERQIATALVNVSKNQAPNLSLGGVSMEDFNRLQEQVAALMDQNIKLQAEKSAMRSEVRRRV